jgi:antitoxin ParD1/3/4
VEACIVNVSIGDRWERFVEAVVKGGRYGSASEVVREGLRLVEERETRLQALKDRLGRSIAEGGEASEAKLDAALAKKAAELAKAGY